jgi:DNA-binding response OmpR family regulator
MTNGVDILIAEDDSVLREVYVKKFTITGYGIRTAKNGEEAILALTEKEPDLLILDLNMPAPDGFGILEKYPRAKRTFPIIVLTNFANEKNRERAMSLGADDYFVKSQMTMRKLLEMVEGLLKARQMWKK